VTFMTSASSMRRLRWVRHAALVLVALFVAHEAVYLALHASPSGEGATTDPSAGHAYWPAFLTVVGLSLLLLVGRAAWGLTAGARQKAATEEESVGPTSWAGEWRQLFGRLAPMTASLFLLQENLEHFLGHGHVEGLAVYLRPGSELALPIVLGVVAALAALGALVRWHEAGVVARLRAARQRHPRPAASAPAAGWEVVAAIARRRLLLADDLRGRAPPALLTA